MLQRIACLGVRKSKVPADTLDLLLLLRLWIVLGVDETI
jgi:hypothetical protein